jgi:hypothetical protein
MIPFPRTFAPKARLQNVGTNLPQTVFVLVERRGIKESSGAPRDHRLEVPSTHPFLLNES